jgi:alpha-1,6-mannosyltransferase
MTRIVQIANFVTETSGGLRTTLRHLARGYTEAGHEVVQVLPGARDHVEHDDAGATRVHLVAPSLPGTGYRVHRDVARVRQVLERLEPDTIEVHDRTTLRGFGSWARSAGVGSVVISHERLDRWLREWLPRHLPLQRIADRSNAALLTSYDAVLCTTPWAAQEFVRLGADNLVVVPLGVDAEAFVPRLSGRDDRDGAIRLVMASRLSREKRPDLAVEAVRELVRRRVPVRMAVCGDGPQRRSLMRLAEGLPIDWLGYVRDRERLAAIMADADVAIAPGPIETFGLAALEAMACGTPAVVNRHSALADLVGTAGRTAPSSGWCIADAVQQLLSVDEVVRRRAARRQAERYEWADSVRGFLAVHRLDEQAAAA